MGRVEEKYEGSVKESSPQKVATKSSINGVVSGYPRVALFPTFPWSWPGYGPESLLSANVTLDVSAGPESTPTPIFVSPESKPCPPGFLLGP